MKQLFILLLISVSIFSCSSNNNGTVTVVPLAPTNLTGSVISTTQINLNWTDNATNEDGYKIERKTGSGNYAVVGSTASNMTTFNDLGLTPNTSYTYRVFAFNSAGNSIQYSNEVTISTQDSIPSWLTNGLVGYWPFNGNANDESGNGNNGTVNGAILASDRLGNANSAYSFTCNSINANINTTSITNQMTLSFWYLRTAQGCISPRVMEFSQGSNLPGQLIIEENYPTGIKIGHVTSAGLSNTFGWMQFNTLVNQTWSHYIYTNDGAIAKIYQNGILINQYNSPGLPVLDGDVAFGWMNHPANDGVNGKLDDISIYNRALSASEVAYLASH